MRIWYMPEGFDRWPIGKVAVAYDAASKCVLQAIVEIKTCGIAVWNSGECSADAFALMETSLHEMCNAAVNDYDDHAWKAKEYARDL